jgi:serine/threonine protein kinase
VRGHSLEDVIARLEKNDAATGDDFPLARRLRIFIQLCNAVAFAHARGVLHRDLKPANVMVGEYGEVLVTDWGIAAPLPDAAGEALRAMLQGAVGTGSAGTPQYMSPEQARGEPLDARSDIYALGAILYELVALRPPIEAGSLVEILARVKNGEIKPLREAAAGVASALEAIVAKATSLERGDRYAAADELVDDVETFLDGRTPRAEGASIARQLGRYYFAHDPAMRRLRVYDIDAWIASAFFLGLGVAALAGARLGSWGWPLVALGVVAGVPTTVRWARFRRQVNDRASGRPRELGR